MRIDLAQFSAATTPPPPVCFSLFDADQREPSAAPIRCDCRPAEAKIGEAAVSVGSARICYATSQPNDAGWKGPVAVLSGSVSHTRGRRYRVQHSGGNFSVTAGGTGPGSSTSGDAKGG